MGLALLPMRRSAGAGTRAVRPPLPHCALPRCAPWPALQELLGQGFSFLATGTDVGLMGEAAAKNAAFVQKLRQGS